MFDSGIVLGLGKSLACNSVRCPVRLNVKREVSKKTQSLTSTETIRLINNNKEDFYSAHLPHKVGAQGALQ